ncbi:MAG: DUF3108 domain-containing protein [Marinilabiliaceae bacterium]|nr:DUF3108 domain-containing protein [Marinilabiliaceae bacterium]
MKNIVFCVVVFMIMTFGLVSAMAQTGSEALRVTGFQAFKPGEDLTYTIKYGFIKGGEGRFSVRDTIVNGKRVNHVVVGGRTTGVPDAFFKVRDTYESFIDPLTQLPVMSVRNIREGKYRYYDVATYNHEVGSVSVHKENRHGVRDTTEQVGPNMLDIVSAFYHARNNSFDETMSVGDTISYCTYFGGEVFPLQIKYSGKEMVKTKWGRVECYRFSPVTEVGRAFKGKDDMHLWISADDNRLPVKIEFEMLVGSFTCELTNYKGIMQEMKTM